MNQDLLHQTGRNDVEMVEVLPLHRIRIDELEVVLHDLFRSTPSLRIALIHPLKGARAFRPVRSVRVLS
jgi:hypothetical protein